MISTACPRCSSSRLSPNITSPSPPAWAIGAHSLATITINTRITYVGVTNLYTVASQRGDHCASCSPSITPPSVRGIVVVVSRHEHPVHYSRRDDNVGHRTEDHGAGGIHEVDSKAEWQTDQQRDRDRRRHCPRSQLWSGQGQREYAIEQPPPDEPVGEETDQKQAL